MARDLLALRVTDDLTVDEAELVDQHVRYCPDCHQRLKSLSESVGVLRQAGLAPSLSDDRKSLWSRLEPRLGPAGRQRSRPLSGISTHYLVAATVALLALTLGWEVMQPAAPQPLADGVQVEASNTMEVGSHWGPAPDTAVRPKLGVLIDVVDEALAQRLGLRPGVGAIVIDVLEDSAAERAGLQSADVVLSIDGRQVFNPRHLAEIIARRPVGSTAIIQLLRDGRVIERVVTLGVASSKPLDEQVKLPPEGRLVPERYRDERSV